MRSTEHWVEVEDFPRYLVSSHGRVVNRMTDKLLKPSVTEKGYLRVTLTNNYEARSLAIHRLVVGSFYDVDLEDLEVNHLDGDKTNNHVSNLKPSTSSENTLHAHATGLISPDSRFRPTRVINVDTGEVFPSASAAARSVGALPNQVAAAIRSTHWKVRGYRFELVEDDQR